MATVRICPETARECDYSAACEYDCTKQRLRMKSIGQPTQPMRMPAYGTPDLGWQCPVCKRVHAPFVPGCNCHERPTSTGTEATRP